MFGKFILTTALTLSVAAYATQAKYKEKLDSWIGHSAQQLVDSWGYPASQMTAPNGNTVYVYNQSSSFVMPTTTNTNARVSAYGNTAYGSATSTTYGGQTINMACATYFEIYGGNVVSWHYQGNACKSR